MNRKAGQKLELPMVPLELGQIRDEISGIFSPDNSRDWQLRFSNSIKPGADLSLVWRRFLVWMLTSDDLGFSKVSDREARLVVSHVVALHLRAIYGKNPSPTQWKAARAAAKKAAKYPTDLVAEWSARSAQYSSRAEIGDFSVRWALLAAARLSALSRRSPNPGSKLWTKDHHVAYARMADKLITLMLEAPTVATHNPG